MAYQKDTNIQVFKIPIEEEFMKQWTQYSLFQNNIYLRYIEQIITKEKSLRKYFLIPNNTDTQNVKKIKTILSNILQVKDKGHSEWYSIQDLVPEFTSMNKDERENLKSEYMRICEKPIISMDSFVSLFDEKIKQFITVNHIQDFVGILYDNYEKIDNVRTLDMVNKKFTNIIYSYLEKMSTVLSKNNSIVMDSDNAKQVLDEVIQANSNSFKMHETVKTGFDTLDNCVYSNGGFQKSRFYLISGKTGFGKSQFLINLTKNFLEQGKTVLFITLENTIEETNDRLFSCISEVKIQDLYMDVEKSKEKIVNFFSKSNGVLLLEHVPQNSLTKQMVDTLVKIRMNQSGKKPDVIIIDYMDLMLYPEKLEERIRLGRLQNQMKQLSQEQNCVVITPTQLNRGAYKEKDVDLDNIAESSGKSWVQDSVIILNGTKELVQNGYVEVFVQKNRHGKSYTKVLFEVDFDIMKFTDTGRTNYDLAELQGIEEEEDDNTYKANKKYNINQYTKKVNPNPDDPFFNQ